MQEGTIIHAMLAMEVHGLGIMPAKQVESMHHGVAVTKQPINMPVVFGCMFEALHTHVPILLFQSLGNDKLRLAVSTRVLP